MRIIIEYKEGETPTVVTEPADGEAAAGETLDGGAAPELSAEGMAADAVESASEDFEEASDSLTGDPMNAGSAPAELAEVTEEGSDPFADDEGEFIEAGAAAGAYEVN